MERRMREVDERHANSCHPQDIPHPAAATDWRSASPACEVLSAEDFVREERLSRAAARVFSLFGVGPCSAREYSFIHS
jgi:hypothetical protein